MGLFKSIYDSVAKKHLLKYYSDEDSGNPHGFRYYDDTQGVLSFNYATGEVTITPTVAVDYYINAQHYQITQPLTHTVTSGTGPLWLAIDANGSVVEYTAFNSAELTTVSALYAYVYRIGSGSAISYGANERHTPQFSKADWIYKHLSFGTAYRSGGALSFVGGTTVNPATTAAVINDEDIKCAVGALAAEATKYKYYRSGAAGVFVRSLGGAGFTTTGALDVAGVPAYNQWTGTTWQLTALGNNNHVLGHIFMSTNDDQKMIFVIGQAVYAQLAAAQTAAQTEIAVLSTSLLSGEFVAAYTVIYKYSGGTLTSVKATSGGEDFLDWRNAKINPVSASSPSNHENLLGLQGGAAGEHYHLTAATYTALVTNYPGFIDFTETVSGSAKTTFTLTGVTIDALHKIDVSIDGRDQPIENTQWSRSVENNQIIMSEPVNVGSDFKARVYLK